MIIIFYSVERDRLRERDRQARVAMSVQAEQATAGGGSNTRHHNRMVHHVNPPLFCTGPIKVSTFFYLFSLLKNECVFLPCNTFAHTRDGVIDRFLYPKYLENVDSKMKRTLLS